MRRLALISFALILAACSQQQPVSETTPTGAPPGQVDGARIMAADKEPGNWMSYGRTYGEDHFSPLDKITADNAKDLGLAWYFDFPHARGLEVTPIVVDGVMYVTGNNNKVYALDAKTGKQIWAYDPEVRTDWDRYACCGSINRGVAVWKGKVYEGTLDGRLIAVDAKTGKLAWETQTTPDNEPYSITGAPRIIKDKVVIGAGGAEFGVRGYIAAYDAETGKQVWRFYTVPGDPSKPFENKAMETAAKTWTGEWWKQGGGGTVWDSMSYDPDLNLIYFGTGNGSEWARKLRSPEGGDNLFLASIVAINADTGDYVWHYQEVPGDQWDYDACQQIVLADLTIDGKPRKVLMQAAKDGYFYVLDRTNGQFISATPFVKTTWAESFDPKTGRPTIAKSALYDTDEASVVWPGPFGAHDWQSMSFDPKSGLVYFSAQDQGFAYSYDPKWQHKPMQWNTTQNADAKQPPEAKELTYRGYLYAWDPVAGKPAWKVEYDDMWNGGALATAGGIVAEGTADGRFIVYRADNGEKLWEKPVQTAVMAGPISYMVDGEQYIAVAAGWGGSVPLFGGGITPIHSGSNRILVYKLGGTVTLPPKPRQAAIPAQPPVNGTPEDVAHGESLYDQYCQNCHGLNVISGGMIPDLRQLPHEDHQFFASIVLNGTKSRQGMPPFGDVLSESDAQDIHNFILKRASESN